MFIILHFYFYFLKRNFYKTESHGSSNQMSELKLSVFGWSPMNIWFLTDSSCCCCCFYRETILINNEQYEEILPPLRRPGSDGGKTPTEVLLLSFAFVILSWPRFISIIMTMMHFRPFKLTTVLMLIMINWSTLISVYFRIHFFSADPRHPVHVWDIFNEGNEGHSE